MGCERGVEGAGHQALSSVYTQLWLDRYLEDRRNDRKLLGLRLETRDGERRDGEVTGVGC